MPFVFEQPNLGKPDENVCRRSHPSRPEIARSVTEALMRSSATRRTEPSTSPVKCRNAPRSPCRCVPTSGFLRRIAHFSKSAWPGSDAPRGHDRKRLLHVGDHVVYNWKANLPEWNLYFQLSLYRQPLEHDSLVQRGGRTVGRYSNRTRAGQRIAAHPQSGRRSNVGDRHDLRLGPRRARRDGGSFRHGHRRRAVERGVCGRR
jgi:hypothetical protein